MFHYRGKGDYFRLGHGSDAHVRKPSLVEGLGGKKIVHVAVGALHCLAVTDTGQVSRGTGWQEDSTCSTVWLSQTPGRLVEGLGGKKIVHVAVGALHCSAVTDTRQVSRGTGGKKIVHVAVWALHCLAVTDTGQVSRGTGGQEHSTCGSVGTALFGCHRHKTGNLIIKYADIRGCALLHFLTLNCGNCLLKTVDFKVTRKQLHLPLHSSRH